MDNIGDQIVAISGYVTIIIGVIFIILFFIMWIKEQIKEK